MNYHAPEFFGAPGWAASSKSAGLWNSIQLGDSALQSVLSGANWHDMVKIQVKIEGWIQFIYTHRIHGAAIW